MRAIRHNGKNYKAVWEGCYYLDQRKLTIIDIDKLNELMFDYRGLIKKKLAIDINTLEKNPYE